MAMAVLPPSLPPASPPRWPKPTRLLALPTSPFSTIPSWVSLTSTSSPPTPSTASISPPAKPGLVENIHLLSLSKQGRFHEAGEFLLEMESNGVPVKTHFFERLFDCCATHRELSFGRRFHDIIRGRLGRNPDGHIGNCLMRMYCDCSSCEEARVVFDDMQVKGPVSVGLMVNGYVQNGLFVEGVSLIADLNLVGIEVDVPLFVTLVTALSSCSSIEFGKQVHAFVVKLGVVPDVSVDTALVNMYVKFGRLDNSLSLFDRMEETNAVTWTGLMVGYTQEDKQQEVLALFERMARKGIELDQFVFSIVLKACSGLADLKTGKEIHGLVVKLGMESDVSAGTPVVDFYVKCGCIVDARHAFEKISHPNEFSWSALISGYSQLGKFEESLEIFNYLRTGGMITNSFIYTSLFQVCSALADSSSGSQVHCDAIKRGLISELCGESALITMYSRSGNYEYACRAFSLIDKPDTVAWTAMIAGCAYHGHASEALRLFKRMQSFGARPNPITFVGIFTACSHAGLVSEALQCLQSMKTLYDVEPTADHYNCMIDIYCRAGRLEEAFELVNSGYFEPDAMTWKILLSGCTICHEIGLGNIAKENLIRLQPQDAAAYVLAFNLYASAGKWEEASSVRKLMNEKGIAKEVGCSWMIVKGKVHRFIVGDMHHSQTKEIYTKLEELDKSISSAKTGITVDNITSNFHDERKHQLLDHSERLAIAFGILSSLNGTPITIFKNLRVCGNCHHFIKSVSKVAGREFIVRDSSRFHHFKDGSCSCADYW